MASKLDTLLEEITGQLSDLVAAAEKAADPARSDALEQHLSDIVLALEAGTKFDAGPIVDAIKGLKLAVTVSPQINVSPAPVTVAPADERPFRELTVKVNRRTDNGFIDTLVVSLSKE